MSNVDPYLEMIAADARPDTEVMLCINDSGKWLLPYKDAYMIASLLNSASRIRSRYYKSKNLDIIDEPDDSATIKPITGRHRILWDTNDRTINEGNK
jgi:hypothetical protein